MQRNSMNLSNCAWTWMGSRSQQFKRVGRRFFWYQVWRLEEEKDSFKTHLTFSISVARMTRGPRTAYCIFLMQGFMLSWEIFGENESNGEGCSYQLERCSGCHGGWGGYKGPGKGGEGSLGLETGSETHHHDGFWAAAAAVALVVQLICKGGKEALGPWGPWGSFL